MNEPCDPLSNADFSDLVEWKAERRRTDAEDVAAGRRTAEQVQRENTEWFFPNRGEGVILNEYETYESL